MGGDRRGQGGERRLRLFPSPLVASAEAKSPTYGKEPLCSQDQLFGRAHLARQCASSRKSSLGARLRTRKVTGRDASLPAPFVERICHTGRPWNSWGVAPNPTRGAASGLRKGQTKRDEVPPLTPFARLSCSLFLTSSACCSFVFFPYFNLSINDVAPNRSGSPSHSAHVAPISA